MTVSRKSTTTPSVSIVFADTERSSPPRGAAAAGLTPKLNAHDKEMRKREEGLEAGSGGDTLSVDGGDATEGLALGQRPRTNSLMSVRIGSASALSF